MRIRPRFHLPTAGSLCGAALLLPVAALAQTAALGNIGGVVRDATGAVVPGATVQVTNTGTGAARTLTTDSEGHYEARDLQPGAYEVVVSGGGQFGKVDRKNVPVPVGAPITVDATLPAANVSTEVTVTSEAPLLDTERVEQSQVIDQEVVSNVPVNSRRFESFVLLTPNVIPDGTTGLIAYRGISGVYNSNIIDGANNNQGFFGEARGRAIGAPYVFPVDAISQFESSSSGYSAELGGAAGGIINAITKSGTNTWHGDAYEYYRTPGWNALDPITKASARSAGTTPLQPVKVQNQFGISIGGPIRRDKLFFHFTYDGFRRVNPVSYLSSFNTSNNVANLVHLCDGGTVNLKDGSTTYPTTIPNVSGTQCAAGVAAVQAQLGAFNRTAHQNIFFPRLDYQLSSKTHLSAEFLWENFHQPNGYNLQPTYTNAGVGANGTADFHERILIANAETAVTSNTANVLHFQWGRDLETDSTNEGGPFMNLNSLATFGETSALPRGAFPDEHRWQITDIYSVTHGRHSLKAGFDVNLIHEQIANLFGGDGSFTYSAATPEANFANWLQDELAVNPTAGATAPSVRHYNSFSQTVDQITGVGADDFWNKNLDGFVEDQWKATPKFLLSAGVRYDVQMVPGPDRPNTTNPVAFNATSQINSNYKMFQPRIGFNWNPTPTTVLRGGYGLFYGLNTNSIFYTERRENGVYQKQYGPVNATTANVPYVSTGANVVVPGQATRPCAPAPGSTVCYSDGGVYPDQAPVGGVPIYTPPGPAPTNFITGSAITIPGSIDPRLAGSITVRGIDPSFSNPYSHSWDLTLEQQLPLHSTLTLGYVGNRGMRLPIYVDTNIDPASATSGHTYAYFNPATGVFQGNVAQTIYTNRLYTTTGPVATGYSVINSNYHSMVVTLRKPMSHGFEFIANETWAKAMDGGQTYGSNGTFNGTDAPIIPFSFGHRQGLGAEYARSDLDVRNRVVLTLVGRSNVSLSNKFAGYAINGWQLSGTYTSQSGEPVTATVNGSISYLTGGRLGTLNDGGVSNAQFFSSSGSANSNVSSTRVPDWIARRNGFAGPGLHNLDARLSREFPIFERYHLELAAEAFNVVNHRNILGVNTALVSYTAPGGNASCPAAPATPTATSTVGCFGPLPSSVAPFMSPFTTSGLIYGPRQLQLLGRLIF